MKHKYGLDFGTPNYLNCWYHFQTKLLYILLPEWFNLKIQFKCYSNNLNIFHFIPQEVQQTYGWVDGEKLMSCPDLGIRGAS